MHFEFDIEGGNFSKSGAASSEVKKILNQLNVDYKLIKRVVVSLYEAEVNVAAHADKGKINVEISPEEIVMILEDEGPGIPDINKAMEAGFTTASQKVREMGFGAGMGLPNINKNADSLNITSTVGVGTCVEIIVKLK